jgi:hypothetical protein
MTPLCSRIVNVRVARPPGSCNDRSVWNGLEPVSTRSPLETSAGTTIAARRIAAIEDTGKRARRFGLN